VDYAITTISAQRGALGAIQRQLEGVLVQISRDLVNLQAAMSRIRDADVAAEQANLVRSSILKEAATAILAQANVTPALVLRLLR